jgi:hypothetical protein
MQYSFELSPKARQTPVGSKIRAANKSTLESITVLPPSLDALIPQELPFLSPEGAELLTFVQPGGGSCV